MHTRPLLHPPLLSSNHTTRSPRNPVLCRAALPKVSCAPRSGRCGGAPQPCDLHVPCPVPSLHTALTILHTARVQSPESWKSLLSPPGPLFSAHHSSATMNTTLPEATPGGTRISRSCTESRTTQTHQNIHLNTNTNKQVASRWR